jgi:hypothetical protein
MTIREALKRVKIIEKQIIQNSQDIQKYSSKVNIEISPFGDNDTQASKVRSIIQSSEDLEKFYRVLKKRISYTNLLTFITVKGQRYSLEDVLILKRKTIDLLKSIYNSLNRVQGEYGLRSFSADKNAMVELMYNECDKYKALKDIQELYDEIDIQQDIVLSTTELLQLPSELETGI